MSEQEMTQRPRPEGCEAGGGGCFFVANYYVQGTDKWVCEHHLSCEYNYARHVTQISRDAESSQNRQTDQRNADLRAHLPGDGCL